MKTIWTKQQKQGGSFVGAVMALMLGIGLVATAQEPLVQRPPEELDALLAPVALYPDALIAVMLPAATAPVDLAQAANFLAAGGAVDQLDAQPWDDSVRTLAHYPELTQWMAANPAWTEAVGIAFRVQPNEVMGAIQRLRVRAQALGNLTSTAQQRVITDQNVITIVPVEPELIYVPQYDPQVIYVQPAPFGCSWITFGYGWRIGGWHRYDFDWRRGDVRIREQHPQYRHPVEVIHAWHPAPVAQHQQHQQPTVVTRTPVAPLQTHQAGAVVQPRAQVQQAVAPAAAVPVATHPLTREVPQHNAIVPHTLERAPAVAPVNTHRESIFGRDHAAENHDANARANVPQPTVQRTAPAAHTEPRAVPQPVRAPVAPVMQSAPQRDAAPRQPAPSVVQRNVPVQRPEQRVNVPVNAAPVAPTAQRHEITARQPAPVINRSNVDVVQRQSVPAPSVTRSAPRVQQDIRPVQAPSVNMHPSAPQAPQPAPAMTRSAPAAQPAPQAAVHAAPAAPQQQQRPAQPNGNNQPGSNDRSSNDRNANGRYGNMARGN